MFEQVHKLFLKKLKLYGTNDIKNEDMVIQRMREKLDRVENLLKANSKIDTDESVEDTFKDLMGYSLIALLIQKGEWHIGETLNNKLLIKRHSKNGGLSLPQKDGDVGHDLFVSEDTTIQPIPQPTASLVPSHVSVKIQDDHFCQILGRSSAANKRGLLVVSAVIDNGYLGELKVCVFNLTGQPVEVKKGERLAQVVFFPMCIPQTKEVKELPETERGTSGYGSSGR